MKKIILPALLVLLTAFLAQAQEIFDMPGATGTYLTGVIYVGRKTKALQPSVSKSIQNSLKYSK